VKHSSKIVALVFGSGMLFGSVAIGLASASDTTTTVTTEPAQKSSRCTRPRRLTQANGIQLRL
jgi:hypothetical protein